MKLSIRTPRCAVLLRGVMYTLELDSAVLKIRISRRNRNLIRKYFILFIRGPDGFQSWKTMEVENLVTHSIYDIINFFLNNLACGMMHIAELDSAVGCTPQSFFWDILFLNSTVGCTTRSLFKKFRKSRQNQKRIRKYFSLFVRVPDCFE